MTNIKSFIKENINIKSDDPFYVFDVEDVIQKHRKWIKLIPRVNPYYAVKANRFPLLLEILIGLGIKFDCASQFELEEILNRSGKPEQIIFANPCKTIASIEFSKKNGIDLMTFDNEEELIKISSVFPEARLVLRIKVDDQNSKVRLSLKFGAHTNIVGKLLERAKDMGMNVIGIAFHVGSGCHSSQAYAEAIKTSREVYDMAINIGFNMSLLDIGGGFPGSENHYHKKMTSENSTFDEMALIINQSLEIYYPERHLTIIGEPGRYYCESAFNLITRIISKTVFHSNDSKQIMYYLNDGIYGSFLDAIIDKKIYEPIPFLNNILNLNLRNIYPSFLWGPTCDSYDCIRSDFQMPEMNIGEWLLFEDMGSYTLPYSQFGFNGIASPSVKIFVSESAENHLKKTQIWTKIKSYLADIKWKQIYQENVWYQMG